MPTAATRTTNQVRSIRCRFAKAIWFCWMCGRRKTRRERLLRHYVDGICGEDAVGPAAGDFQDCERGARHRREDGAGCGLGRAAHLGMGSGSRGARADQAGEVRDYFIHRTGHSIATEVHANGSNMDDLEIMTSGAFCPIPCSRSSPASTCPSSACGWRWMCWCGRAAPRSLVKFNERS